MTEIIERKRRHDGWCSGLSGLIYVEASEPGHLAQRVNVLGKMRIAMERKLYQIERWQWTDEADARRTASAIRGYNHDKGHFVRGLSQKISCPTFNGR